MRSIVFVTTAVLALSLSTAARADDRDRYSDRYDDRYRGHYDQGYRGDSRRMDAIAREIEQTAAAMHREFERNNRRPNRDEARAAAALHELHEEANQFARYSGRYSGSYNNRGSRYGNGYDGLLRAFDEVAYSLDRINRRPYVDQGMDRIWSLMSQLDRSHGGRSDRYGRGWRNDGWRNRSNYYRH